MLPLGRPEMTDPRGDVSEGEVIINNALFLAPLHSKHGVLNGLWQAGDGELINGIMYLALVDGDQID